MSECTLIDLSSPPYDASSVQNAYDSGGCPGVNAHFQANPIQAGDCIRVGGEPYRVVAVVVKCGGAAGYTNGTPPPGQNPDHVHDCTAGGVWIGLWLTPSSEEEMQNCG